jgi:UDP-2,3-diacylglucosamine pyrophosphatase LpxH
VIVSERDSFDCVYVVSDLHLGGPRGRQLFGSTDALVALIGEAKQSAGGRQTAFVLAGDIFDFLCEDYAQYFDPYGAPGRIARISRGEAFGPIFTALREFLAEPQARLYYLLGNHDIEVALPEARAALLRALGSPDGLTLGSFEFCLDEIKLRVGGRSILIVHGNRYDAWNVVDHRALLAVAAAQGSGAALPPLEANGGTRLVIDVINELKATYPFVDLLKPEAEAVSTVLISVADVFRLAGLVPGWYGADRRRRFDRDRLARGLLSARRQVSRLGSPALESGGREIELSADELWRQVATAREGGVEPVDLVRAGGSTLDAWDAVKAGFSGASRRETMRQGLASFVGDATFDTGTRDEWFVEMDRKYPPVDFLIAGHTHLARSIDRGRKHGHYFNTGTWMKLIQVRDEWLAPGNFEPFAERLLNSTLDGLEEPFRLRVGTAAGTAQSIIWKRPTYALIERQPGSHVVGRLLEREGSDWGGGKELGRREY